jgi:hypothetical protein
VAYVLEHADGAAATELRFEYDSADRAYVAHVNITRAGEYMLVVAVGGQAIPGGPFPIIVAPARVHPPHCFVYSVSPSVSTAGSATLVSVQSVDLFGNRMGCGGSIATADVNNTDGASSLLALDVGDGVYSLEWLPTRVGVHWMRIAVDGQAISGDPLQLNVQAGRAAAEFSRIVRLGNSSVAEAGETTMYELQILDDYNNSKLDFAGSVHMHLSELECDRPVDTCMDTLSCRCEVSSKIPRCDADLNATRGAPYVVSVACTKSGFHQIELLIGRPPILVARPTVFFVRPACFDANNSVLLGRSRRSSTRAGKTSVHLVELRDRYHNRLLDGRHMLTESRRESNRRRPYRTRHACNSNSVFLAISDDSLCSNPTRSAVAVGPSTVQGSVKLHSAGRYEVQWSTSQSGEYALNIQAGSEHINESPVSVKILAESKPSAMLGRFIGP